MTKFKNNITKSIDNLNILDRDLHLVYGDELETNIDNMLENNIYDQTGSDLTYNNTVDSGKLDFDVIGNCEQEGTPTPDAPIPIKVVTGDNDVILMNKNIFDNTMELGAIGGANGTNSPNNNMIRTTNYIDLNGIRKIAITTSNKSVQTIGLRFYNKKKQYLGSFSYTSLVVINLDTINVSNQTQYYTSNSDIYYLRFTVTTSNDLTIKYGVMNNTTEYIEHKENKHTLHLANLELCKIGDYSDKIIKTATGWNVVKNIGKIILNGSENCEYISIPQGSLFRYDNIIEAYNDRLYIPLSNYYKGIPTQYYQGRQNNQFYINVLTEHTYLDFIDNRFNNVEDYQSWLESNNVTILYLLKTPVEIPITDTTLIADLDALYNDAVTYEGQTNIIIESDSDNAQMILDVSVFVTEKEV